MALTPPNTEGVAVSSDEFELALMHFAHEWCKSRGAHTADAVACLLAAGMRMSTVYAKDGKILHAAREVVKSIDRYADDLEANILERGELDVKMSAIEGYLTQLPNQGEKDGGGRVH